MKNFFKFNLAASILFLFFSCQKESTDFSNLDFDENNSLKIKYVSANEIPRVMDFLRNKNESNLKFSINTINTDGIYRNNEPDLLLGDLELSRILTNTDQTQKTNYSFQLKLENPPQYEDKYSFFNLIVKEISTVEGFYGYIQEYRVDEQRLVQKDLLTDFDTFSGEMVFYNLEGLYVAKATFINGVIIDQSIRNPCDDGNGSGGSGGGGDGGSGGGGDGGTGDTGGGTGGTGGTGGGTGGGTTTVCGFVIIGYIPCSYCGGNGSGSVPVYQYQCHEIMKNLVPCDTPPECFQPNGDDCPCDANGSGCADENPNISINIILPPCQQLLKISEHANTRNKILNLWLNYLNNTDEYGFSIFENPQSGNVVSSDIVPGKGNSFRFSPSSNAFGAVHTHPNSPNNAAYPMFSMTDILALNQLYNQFLGGGSNINKPTLILVGEHGVFALKIENLIQFQNFVNNNDFVKLDEQMKRKYNNIIKKNPFSNTIPYQKSFLQSIQNAGISLYQANQDLSGWIKIVLNEQGQTQQTEPCNF